MNKMDKHREIIPMRITTKTGDKGITSLYLKGRVSKDDIRCEVCGDLDELCSFLGLAKSIIKTKKVKEVIDKIQRDLFIIGTEIATKIKFISKLEKRIGKVHVSHLEKEIKKIEKKINFKKGTFLLPGDNIFSSILDTTRTIARRAERRIATLKKKNMLKNNYILVYLNRLSDLLYLLARSFEKKSRFL